MVKFKKRIRKSEKSHPRPYLAHPLELPLVESALLINHHHRPVLHVEIQYLVRIGTLDGVFDVLDRNPAVILGKKVIDFLRKSLSSHHFLVC